MDEPKTTPPTESAVEPPVQTDARTMLEQAFARGSRHLSEAPPVAAERTEHSVMEGLPPAKAERIAAMRRELADLQRHLIEAQQRIATELQGRAEDAERFEALEARLQAHEAKAQEDAARSAEIASLQSQLSTVTATGEELRREVASRDAQLEEARQGQRAVAERLEAQGSLLNEAKTHLETRNGELAARTTERDTEQAARAQLERELEDHRKQHGEVTSQLDLQFASLRDANATIATRDAELAAITSEREALKGELAAARAKTRDVANQLARFGHDLLEGVGDAQLASSSDPNLAVAARSERPKPPPVPSSRTAIHTSPPPVEAILEVTEEPRSRSRTGLVLIGGVILGFVATIAVVKASGSTATTAAERQDVGTAPAAALVVERPSDPASPSAAPGQALAATAQPAAVSDTDVNGRPNEPTDSPPTAPAANTTDGVIVLPQEASDHRVFVDGRVVPVKDSRAVVPCGTREIRIGSRGAPRTLNVACGSETAVPVDPRDR